MIAILLAALLSFGATAPLQNNAGNCTHPDLEIPVASDSLILMQFKAFPLTRNFWLHHIEVQEVVKRGERSDWIKPTLEPNGTLFMVIATPWRTGHVWYDTTRVDTLIQGCSQSLPAYAR